MPSNKGATTLKSKRRTRNPMAEYDRLPAELRSWVATAILPWRAGSVRAAYDKAMTRTNDPWLALQELDRLQNALVARDAKQVWGDSHPTANS